MTTSHATPTFLGPRKKRDAVRGLLLSIGLLVLVGVGLVAANRAAGPAPMPPTEIFRGVTYTCFGLPTTAEGSGLVHIVRVDLTAPGVGLYLTPLDPEAVVEGFEYRLAHSGTVAEREGLAVVVNGTLFGSNSGWLPRAGDLARACETVVAEHDVNHVDPDSYLLWFEDDLTPHLEKSKPPPQTALAEARWGIGSEFIALCDGKVSASAGREPDSHTMVGLDSRKRVLWLAAFKNASLHVAAQVLADSGARDAIMLDGGDSTTSVPR